MEKLQFKIDIKADVDKVFNTMLGQDTFKQWTAVFNPSSSLEGDWRKGSKMRFIGVNKKGKKEGLVGEVKENIPNKFVSVQYIGLLDGENEITAGPEVDGWVGSYENYAFDKKDGTTTVTVDLDVTYEFIDYFNKTYPKALDKLKEIAEA
jgi:uncharacterized protein YndB with AHSA1/START domain